MSYRARARVMVAYRCWSPRTCHAHQAHHVQNGGDLVTSYMSCTSGTPCTKRWRLGPLVHVMHIRHTMYKMVAISSNFYPLTRSHSPLNLVRNLSKVITGLATSDATLNATETLAKEMGKVRSTCILGQQGAVDVYTRTICNCDCRAVTVSI